MGYEWHDFVGNVGVVAILGCYLLAQLGRLDIQRPAYSIANGIGACLIIVSLLHDFNLSSFIIEIAWLTISVIGLARWLRQRQHG